MTTETAIATETGPTNSGGIPLGTANVADLLKEALGRAAATTVNLPALMADADVVQGRSLVDKASMVGVPHVITSMSFRKGNMDANKVQHDYVSVEFTTVTDAPIEAVYNDGSTGIRRQCVQFLAMKGLIAPAFNELPDDAVWQVTDEDDPTYEVRLIAPRGLRVSEYSNEYTDEGVTYYFA